ncbi:Cysteine-rich membrane protein 2 [Spironucleus salmonicida]|uniref:Cysteine-rich membrane protein 2 n=1 Tax=Spironucleus salmonicida TaxID=348837 RepID=A0A9P8LKM4_9EUKA|nr:Cysteine-rich membrane protein 2 [Spironucleus salmonicida]
MDTTGTCTRTDTNCKAGHFCPTTDTVTVDCIPCTENMKFGQGCYCKDKDVTTNCKVCTGEACTTCLPGSFLNSNVCTKCSKGCGECTSLNTCQNCAEGYTMDENTCVRVCRSNEDCEDTGSTYCEIGISRCRECSPNCTICQSPDFCYACDGTTHITTISGQCTLNCDGLTDGNYCKHGQTTPCDEGIDSACQCGGASNCASCNTELTACATCLPNGIKADNGKCIMCATGFKLIGDMCWGEEKSGEANRMGTGAIVGIVVGVLVVVGAVGGGLAYYFIRKGNK